MLQVKNPYDMHIDFSKSLTMLGKSKEIIMSTKYPELKVGQSVVSRLSLL